jgi:hypothetical protein
LSSRLVRDAQGRLFVEVTTPALGARRYRARGTEIRAEVDFTGQATGRQREPSAPRPQPAAEPSPDGWLVG